MHIKTWYLEALAKEIHNAKHRVESLAHQVYPSDTLSEFVRGELSKLIHELWLIVRDQLRESNARADAPLSPKCAEVISFWRSGYIQSVIASVSEADIHSHPLEMMLYIRELARQVVPGESIEVVTVPKETLNYSFRPIWQSRRPVLRIGSQAIAEQAVKYVELTYPKGEKDNILRSTVFAHELGHYVDHALGLTKRLLPRAYAAILPHIPQLRRADVVRAPGVSDIVVAQLIVSGILTSWLQEAVADTFAVRVLGPAFYFCYAELAGLIGGTQAGARIEILDVRAASHPRSSLRIQHLWHLLRELEDGLPVEVRQATDEILKMFETRVRVMHGATTIGNRSVALVLIPSVYEVLERVWQSLLPQVTEIVDAAIPEGNVFKSADYKLARLLVKERLEWLIPPNEHEGQPVKPSVIINAGWYARQFSLETIKNRMKSLPDGLEGNHNAVDMLNGLLKYALYATYVHERWLSA